MLRCIQSNQSLKRICRKQIRCVLEFENNLFLIIRVSPNEDTVVKCKWNYYQGFKHIEEEVPQRILAYARKIIDLNSVDPTRYPLGGEWYSIKAFTDSDRLRWNLKRTKKKYKTTVITACSYMLCFLIAMAFAGLIMSWTVGQAKGWLNSLFPMFDRMTLTLVAYIVEFAGSALLFFMFRDRRGVFDLYFNAFIPFGIIVIAGLLKCYWWMWIVIPIGLTLAFFVSVAVMAVIMEESNLRCREYVRIALSIFTMVTMIIVSLGGLNAYSHMSKSNDLLELTIEEAQRQHRDNCYKLEKETWNALTVQEKLDLLQMICDYECTFVLGCENVKIYSGLTSRDTVFGEYSDQTKSFTINEEHLRYGDVEDVVDTVLHEVRHAYQHTWVEMYSSLENHIKDEYKNLLPFKQAQSFSEEFDDYCSGEDDFYGYFMQDVEKDSREKKKKRLKEYYITFIYPDR